MTHVEAHKFWTQEEAVLALFREIPAAKLSARGTHEALIGRGWVHQQTELGSIRRALSNLSVAGELIKNGDKDMVVERGKRVRTWSLSTGDPQLRLL